MRKRRLRQRAPSHSRRIDAILEVLRGTTTVAAAARQLEVSSRDLLRWRRRFLEAGKRALALDVPAAADSGAPRDEPSPRGEAWPATISAESAQRWFRMLPEQISGVSWTTDEHLRFTSVHGARSRTGEDVGAQLVGLSLYEIFETDDPSFGPIANHLRALEGEPGSYETVFANRVFHYRLEALRDASGRVTGVLGTALDVTEGKRSKSVLHEHEARLRVLLEQLPVILWTADDELRITSSIGAGLATLGLAPNELTGMPLYEYLQDTRRESLVEGHLGALQGRSGKVEHRLRDRYYQTYFEPLRGLEGTVVGVLGLTIDITERKLAERQREEVLAREQAAREQAEEASRLKDEFLATISHELRTPLNAILGWAHLLREEELDAETRARALETIERNSRAQAHLIQDLLDVSNVVTGRTRLDMRPVSDLAPIVLGVVDALRASAVAKGIELHHACEVESGPILGDPERLQQIVWNLVSNAIKFTPHGGRVEVRLARAGEKVAIEVRDTGEGISPDFMPYLFDRFRQADASAARRHPGLGLGLAIVRHLAELQGGEVRAESEGRGRGATFTVTFPVLSIVLPAVDDVTSAAASAADALGVSLDGLRIMAIDDEPDTLEMIRHILERCRAQVRTATSALEGLDQLRTWTPDVLVADIGMPVRDGYWLIRRVRDLAPERGGKVPAVALTAFARTEDRLRTLAAGYQTHVAKPVEPAELVAVVSSLSRLRS